jgi:hypothetical protein
MLARYDSSGSPFRGVRDAHWAAGPLRRSRRGPGEPELGKVESRSPRRLAQGFGPVPAQRLEDRERMLRMRHQEPGVCSQARRALALHGGGPLRSRTEVPARRRVAAPAVPVYSLPRSRSPGFEALQLPQRPDPPRRLASAPRLGVQRRTPTRDTARRPQLQLREPLWRRATAFGKAPPAHPSMRPATSAHCPRETRRVAVRFRSFRVAEHRCRTGTRGRVSLSG